MPGLGGRASSREPVCRGVCAHSIEGGELFERIVDEDYHLTEVDTMVFVRQICDGILFMHKMRVLHLDLKVVGWNSTDHWVSLWSLLISLAPPTPSPSFLPAHSGWTTKCLLSVRDGGRDGVGGGVP